MKLLASLCVAWLAVAAAGCCHGQKNDCCCGPSGGVYYNAVPHAASSCSSCGTVSHGELQPTPTPVEAPAYEVAPMPPK